MDQQTIQTIFVIVAAVALVIQAIMLIVVGLVASRLVAKIMPLVPEVQNILGLTRRTIGTVETYIDKAGTHIDKVGEKVEQIGNTSISLLDTTKEQLTKIDGLLTDAVARARNQMDRAELVIDDSMSRVHHTVTLINSAVLRPVREVHGVLSGFKATLAHLSRSGRPTVDHATSDEEMFI
ncbi:MAG TPA: hypothetical protein VLJ11_01200 [Bryobacteraceae bacterium]|nr:hypothetical protein [Bryobacteraceae bacterium]